MTGATMLTEERCPIERPFTASLVPEGIDQPIFDFRDRWLMNEAIRGLHTHALTLERSNR